MNNNPDVPDGWVMPDDLAKKGSEVLYKKPLSLENEREDPLDELARDIALIEPDPEDWAGWVAYLLEQMEGEAKKRGKHNSYLEMLRTLR